MMVLHCVALEAQARFAQEFGRQREVMLRAIQINVAKVGGKVRQQTLHIRSAAVPGHEPMDRSGMAKIMQPRLVKGSITTSDASKPA
jgi:hypothetical protein